MICINIKKYKINRTGKFKYFTVCQSNGNTYGQVFYVR